MPLPLHQFATAPASPTSGSSAALMGESSKISQIWSARISLRQLPLHMLIGSEKVSRWPEAFQMAGCMMMEASSPSTSSRSRTMNRHQRSLMLRFSSQPSGP